MRDKMIYNIWSGKTERVLPCPTCKAPPIIHSQGICDEARCPNGHFKASGFFDGEEEWCLSRWNVEVKQGKLKAIAG